MISNPLANYDAADLDTTLASYLGTFLNLALIIGGIAVLYFLVAGSIRYMTSGGDKAGTETAQKMITNALVGLLLLVASVPVVKFIGGYFGVPGEFFEINLDFITGPPEEEPQE